MEGKNCSICNEYKTYEEYYRLEKIRKKTGESYTYYYPDCKKCFKLRRAQWERENPDKKKISRKKYQSKKETKLVNLEQQRRSLRKGTRREWQRNNKVKVREYNTKRKEKEHQISINEWDACRLYFDYRCAYCGKAWEDQHKEHKKDFCKDHFLNDGSNDILNCIPSCTNCNSSKNIFDFDHWYNENNERYSVDRFQKIHRWIKVDAKNNED